MNWKEHAYLFTNGSFSAYYGQDRNESHLIVGLQPMFGDTYFTDDNNVGFPISGCTLIARRIEDITTRELIECPYLADYYYRLYIEHSGNVKPYLMSRLFDLLSNREVFLYLIGKGIYPFGQKAFKTGEIIDIKTIE